MVAHSYVGRAWVVLASIVALIVLGACSTATPPQLPQSSDKVAIAEEVRKPGSAFLNSVVGYPWEDAGRDAGQRFDWIPSDATSPNMQDATRAGETAQALAGFLADEQSEIGELPPNEALYEAFSGSLIPYIGALVGDTEGVVGFRQLDDVGTSMPRTTALYATMSARKAATMAFDAGSAERAQSYIEKFVDAASKNPASATSTGPIDNLLRAARLKGLTAAGARLAFPDAPDPPLLGERTEVAYALARVMLQPNDPSIDPAYFDTAGRLLSPDALPDGEWSAYDAQLRQSLAVHPAIADALNLFEVTYLRIANGKP